MLARSRQLYTQNSLTCIRSLATKSPAPMPVEPAAPERAEELRENYDKIVREVEQATQRRGAGPTVRTVRSSHERNRADPTMLRAASTGHGFKVQACIGHSGAVRAWRTTLWRELPAGARGKGAGGELRTALSLSKLALISSLASLQLPKDIAWHFIGTLQSNKCKMLAG